MALRAQRAAAFAEVDALVKLVQPDVGGVLRTHNQIMVVYDDDGAVFERLSKAAGALRTLDEETPCELRDPVLIRRLARLYHGHGIYCQAAKQPQDAIVHLNKERQLLEQLFEQPPQEDGSWRSGAKPWPQDRRALSICHLTLAEVMEAACLGRGSRAVWACEHYSAGLRLQMPAEGGNNAAARARFEELKNKIGWSEAPPAPLALTLAPSPNKRAKVETSHHGNEAAAAEASAAEASEAEASASPDAEDDEVDDEDDVETDGWERIELRCAIGRDRLRDPAKLIDCRHAARCNFNALRLAGSLCPVMGCYAKNRHRHVVRDEGLANALSRISPTIEFALVRGDQVVADEPAAQVRSGTLAVSEAASVPEVQPLASQQEAAVQIVRAAPTLAALVAVIREQLAISEDVVWRVLAEGERMCFQGEPPAGTLLERAGRVVAMIGKEVL